MRNQNVFSPTLTALALALALSAPASAQTADYSGKWSFSGLLVGSRMVMSFAQICDLTQTGQQISGPCHGPNGGCSLVGVLSGVNIDLTCRTTATNNPDLAGVGTFHGAMGPDGLFRGTWTHTRTPGTGTAAMMRI